MDVVLEGAGFLEVSRDPTRVATAVPDTPEPTSQTRRYMRSTSTEGLVGGSVVPSSQSERDGWYGSMGKQQNKMKWVLKKLDALEELVQEFEDGDRLY
jgi:hypothetical protein